MSVTTELRKTVEDVRAAATDPKPLHALAGAGDLLVARVRTATSAQRDSLRSIRVEPAELPGRVTAAAAAVKDALIDLPERAQGRAADTVQRANTTYDDLARRGATLVRRVRRQQATQDLEDQVAETVQSARKTGSAAKSAAKTTAGRARSTAGTARSTTKATTTRARSTAAAGRKTAAAAAKATKKASEKVGTTKVGTTKA